MKIAEKIAGLVYHPEDGKSSQRLYNDLVRKIEPELFSLISNLAYLFETRSHSMAQGDVEEIKKLIKDNL